jgi:HPt (histidine-containing phosphotransfer) domain-containing protein
MAHVATITVEQLVVRVAVLDQDHLKRMAFGDRSLERELLHLFDRQSEILLSRMRASDPAAVATLAHTLKGSASGIGAGSVAQAAEAVELAAERAPAELDSALDRLDEAVGETRALIADLLRAH